MIAMADRPRRRPLLGSLIGMAMLMGACKGQGRDDSNGILPAGPSVLSVRALETGLDEGGLTLTSTMPDDFPATLRVYPGARVTLGGRRPTPTGKRSWSLTVETADSKDRV